MHHILGNTSFIKLYTQTFFNNVSEIKKNLLHLTECVSKHFCCLHHWTWQQNLQEVNVMTNNVILNLQLHPTTGDLCWYFDTLLCNNDHRPIADFSVCISLTTIAWRHGIVCPDRRLTCLFLELNFTPS